MCLPSTSCTYHFVCLCHYEGGSNVNVPQLEFFRISRRPSNCKCSIYFSRLQLSQYLVSSLQRLLFFFLLFLPQEVVTCDAINFLCQRWTFVTVRYLLSHPLVNLFIKRKEIARRQHTVWLSRYLCRVDTTCFVDYG